MVTYSFILEDGAVVLEDLTSTTYSVALFSSVILF
jgi:hypothetical protein